MNSEQAKELMEALQLVGEAAAILRDASRNLSRVGMVEAARDINEFMRALPDKLPMGLLDHDPEEGRRS